MAALCLMFLGAALAVAGVAMFSIPAAVVVCGVVLVAAGRDLAQ